MKQCNYLIRREMLSSVGEILDMLTREHRPIAPWDFFDFGIDAHEQASFFCKLAIYRLYNETSAIR